MKLFIAQLSIIMLITSCGNSGSNSSKLNLEDGATFSRTPNEYITIQYVYNKSGNYFLMKMSDYESDYPEDNKVYVQNLREENQGFVFDDIYWFICDSKNYGQKRKERNPKMYGDKVISDCPVTKEENKYSLNKELTKLTLFGNDGNATYSRVN
jgi:hypothetical protein